MKKNICFINLIIILLLYFCLIIYVYIIVFDIEWYFNGVEDYSFKFMYLICFLGNVGSKVLFLIISE